MMRYFIPKLCCLHVVFFLFIIENNVCAKTNFIENKKNPVNSLNISKKRLVNLSARHRVLSQNIANANTPFYKVKDLKVEKNFPYGHTKFQRFRLVTTSPKHFSGTGYLKNKIIKVKSLETKPNGNNVSIEEELPKISQNVNDYNSTLKIYSALNNLITTTINNR